MRGSHQRELTEPGDRRQGLHYAREHELAAALRLCQKSRWSLPLRAARKSRRVEVERGGPGRVDAHEHPTLRFCEGSRCLAFSLGRHARQRESFSAGLP